MAEILYNYKENNSINRTYKYLSNKFFITDKYIELFIS